MNTTRILLALSAILLWDIHRLSAPIVEEPTPTPKPKRHVAADEKIANWTVSRWLGAKFQAPIQKNGTTLTWNYEKHDIAGKTLISASLRIVQLFLV